VALFEGAIFNPHTVAAVFHQASLSAALHDGYISAVFNPLSETAVNATPLIFTGLSVTVAFRAGLFNIGGTGQWIGGAIVATWLGFGVSLPPFIHVVVCVIGAFAGGAVIGWAVGELKARTGAHEVIVTIMLNYVMIYLLSYLLGTSALARPNSHNLVSPFIAGSAVLPHIAGPSLRIHAGFLVALAAAAGVWWLLSRSTLGFEFRAVGANPSAARAGVILGTDHYLTFQSYGTYGIDGITVALLGRARPLGTVLAALLFGALDAGGVQLQAVTQTPVSIVEVVQALIVLFIAAPPFIRALYRLRGPKEGGAGETLSKGWGA
jgi:simple sugar transport system permease protein